MLHCYVLNLKLSLPSITSKSPILPFFLFLLFVSSSSSTFNGGFPSGPEKRTQLHFFFQDIDGGPNPTTVRIANPSNSPTLFGLAVIADDPLTETAELKSKLVGRAQGIYAGTSREEISLLMLLNFVFLSGEFNGSTITIMGRNAIFSGVREFPIVGGTGKFRMARGYVQAKTHGFNLTSHDTTVEYNVYVLHQ